MPGDGSDDGCVGRGGRDLPALVYDKLRALAARYLREESGGHTLQPTALVHEAYLRLGGRLEEFESHLHYIHTAAKVMRQVLADHAKARRAIKRGGDRVREDLTLVSLPAGNGRASAIDILALEEALERLAQLEPRHAQIVELRFFGGLTNAEVAQLLDCSVSTVEKNWRTARAWLHKEMAETA